MRQARVVIGVDKPELPANQSKVKVEPKKPKAKKKIERAKKIDWKLAFEYYCEDMTRTYMDVGKKFGVTKDAVARHAAKGEYTWVERRLSVIEKLEKRALKQRYKDASKRDDSHLKHFRAVITASTNTVITEGNKGERGDWQKISKAAKSGYDAIMGERIILGLPTLIARSEVLRDEEELPPAMEAQKTAEALAERAKRLKEMRNDG